MASKNFGKLSIEMDTRDLARVGNLFAAAAGKAPLALARALNHTGAKAKTQMVRALVIQTGLKRPTFVRALKPSNASAGRLSYEITSYGGDVSLKYFGARETRKGVSAAPWNDRGIYDGTFMKAGWFPNRVSKGNWNGQVWRRTGTATASGMDRFEKQKSGLFIPEEMVRDESAKAFNDTASRDLGDRLAHELTRIIG
nr:hypothetical protein NG677_04215 [Methylobacterium sp. OTU13CASTA1]